jgi:hypothetical protein
VTPELDLTPEEINDPEMMQLWVAPYGTALPSSWDGPIDMAFRFAGMVERDAKAHFRGRDQGDVYDTGRDRGPAAMALAWRRLLRKHAFGAVWCAGRTGPRGGAAGGVQGFRRVSCRRRIVHRSPGDCRGGPGVAALVCGAEGVRVTTILPHGPSSRVEAYAMLAQHALSALRASSDFQPREERLPIDRSVRVTPLAAPGFRVLGFGCRSGETAPDPTGRNRP